MRTGIPLLAMAGAVLWLTAGASAQTVRGNGQAPGISSQRNTPPKPPTPPPPPPAPGSGHASGSTSGAVDQFLATPRTYAPRYDRRSQWRGGPRFPRGYGNGNGYGYIGLPPFGYGYGYPYYGDPDPVSSRQGWGRPATQDTQGRLALTVTPLSAQVLVDGFYVGLVEDFADRGLWLDPGARRIELRADGYDTATFDVHVEEGETVSYQRNLARLTRGDTSRLAAAVPKKFYVIRGCYAGDTRPTADRLPAGCRAADVREIPASLSVVKK